MKELVIKIPEEDFERCKKKLWRRIDIMGDAIANGTELPKGHKELIDTKELIQCFVKAEENMKGNGITPVFDVDEIINMILSQKVIVDADT